ncbi:MAG: glycosyltransferase involved in cell wall biosynthesis [Myxococcota bacterium]|jgi:glycosyltransferase involved in cell wall biosynthesis
MAGGNPWSRSDRGRSVRRAVAGGVRSLFWLYRPSLPSVRAQSIQVVNSAHAAAVRGNSVRLCVDPVGGASSAAELLAPYGLAPHPRLQLVPLPRNPLGSLVFRQQAFLAARRGDLFVARSKRYARALMRMLPARVVIEAHEVDSRQVAERGDDPGPWLELERKVLGGAAAVVANCPGTLDLLRRTHPRLPPAIALHNATHTSRRRQPVGRGQGALYAGSVRDYKGLAVLARAARQVDFCVTLLGATSEQAAGLQRLAGGCLKVAPPVPHVEVPDRLAEARVLVLPAAGGLFGSRLTSPLKLWDYLASGRPVVAADTPALRDAAGAGAAYYRVGDAADLARVLARVHAADPLAASVAREARTRTWAERAAELDGFLADVLR